jgi:cell division protein FtsB
MKWKFNIWSLLFLFILVYFIFVLREDVQRYKSLVNDKHDLARRIAQEKEKERELYRTAGQLRQKDYVDDLARQRLNLIKKGEKAYKVCRTR